MEELVNSSAFHAGDSGIVPQMQYKVRIPDRWVKLALEIRVIPEIYHVSLAGVVIIECALRKNSHRLLLKYIGRDGTELYFMHLLKR